MKHLYLLICLFLPIPLSSQTLIQGPNNPDSTYQCSACPGIAWTSNPPNWVIFFMPPDTFSTVLYHVDYGFSVPAGSIITGIKVEFQGDFLNPYAKDTLMQLVLNGTLMGNNLALNMPYIQTPRSYGDSLNNWGATLSPVIVNDPNFGIALQIDTDSGPINGGLPKPKMTVYYQNPSSGTNDLQTSNRFHFVYSSLQHAIIGDEFPNNASLSIFDISGRLLFSHTITSNEQSNIIPLPSDLHSGIYLANIQTQEGKSLGFTRFFVAY
jgi:hypothetical protein